MAQEIDLEVVLKAANKSLQMLGICRMNIWKSGMFLGIKIDFKDFVNEQSRFAYDMISQHAWLLNLFQIA